MKRLQKDLIYVTVLVCLSGALLLIPTGFERPTPEYLRQAPVRVLTVDNSLMQRFGIIQTGAQRMTVEVLSGPFQGERLSAENRLIGKMELDKIFGPGDTAFASLKHRDGVVLEALLHEHYRTDITIWLFVAFAAMLILCAGLTGVRALLTFVFTGLFLWRILFPAFLRGNDPVWISLGAIMVLSAVIIFCVAGFNRKGTVAFLGAVGGIAVTCVLSIALADSFKLHGAVRPFSETLLHTGFPFLNISRLFLAGIFIASSGAVMDIATDIAASMNELWEKNVRMRPMEWFRSGMAIGKVVIGTMTTTLLLAYTGGYTAMFMVFMVEGKTPEHLLNLQYLSAEIFHTLVGSFGLVTVAPLTALFGALLYGRVGAPCSGEEPPSTTGKTESV